MPSLIISAAHLARRVFIPTEGYPPLRCPFSQQSMILHTSRVAGLVTLYDNCDENMLAAAWLHDLGTWRPECMPDIYHFPSAVETIVKEAAMPHLYRHSNAGPGCIFDNCIVQKAVDLWSQVSEPTRLVLLADLLDQLTQVLHPDIRTTISYPAAKQLVRLFDAINTPALSATRHASHFRQNIIEANDALKFELSVPNLMCEQHKLV